MHMRLHVSPHATRTLHVQDCSCTTTTQPTHARMALYDLTRACDPTITPSDTSAAVRVHASYGRRHAHGLSLHELLHVNDADLTMVPHACTLDHPARTYALAYPTARILGDHTMVFHARANESDHTGPLG